MFHILNKYYTSLHRDKVLRQLMLRANSLNHNYNIIIYTFNSGSNDFLTFIMTCIKCSVHLPSYFVYGTKLEYILPDKHIWDYCTFTVWYVENINHKIYIFYMFTLDMEGIVSGLIHIYTSPFIINSYYHIARGIVAGILWPRSNSINIFYTIKSGRVTGKTWPTYKTSVITWGRADGLLRHMSTTLTTSTIARGRVDGIKRPMSMTLLTRKHFNTLFLRTFIVILTMTGGRMDGLTRPRS